MGLHKLRMSKQTIRKPVIQRDLNKMKPAPVKRRVPYAHWAILFVSVALFGVVFFLVSDIAVATRHNNLAGVSGNENFQQVALHRGKISQSLDLPDIGDSQIDAPINLPNVSWKTVTVEKGDTLSTIFSRLKINPRDLHKIVRLKNDKISKLKRLVPGEELKFLVIDDDLHELIYTIDETQSLHILRSGSTFTASDIKLELEKRIAYAAGAIESSLFLAAQEAGIPGGMTMELAKIFGWDIDFVLDVKTGDRFSLIYEELYLDGKKVRTGEILAAEFINKGNSYRAVRYTDKNGRADYYTPEGKSMRKLFLRTPVDFARISSKFGKRYHPILNRMRAHKGVDYAAPTGTPIRSAGDGKIKFIGKKGGYGNTIIVQHGGRYSTLYSHMQKFSGGLRRGSTVKQGEIIGYVGKSGLATGPHLHYEFRVNGLHRNPLTVKLPDATPITARYREDFRLNTQGYLTLLDTLGQTSVAMSSSKSNRNL